MNFQLVLKGVSGFFNQLALAKREEIVQKTKRCQWGFPGGASGKEL